jgi:signal peptidase II
MEVFDNDNIIILWKVTIKLEHTINTGINFGLASNMMDGKQTLYGCLSIALCTLIVLLGIRSSERIYKVIAGMFAGGGLANAYERVVYGGVFDYLNVSLIEINNPFSFNLADVYLFLALFLYICQPRSAD